jgi:hypothetical protein
MFQYLLQDSHRGDTMNDIGKAFSAPFHDPAWISKFLVAGIFLLLSVVLIGIPFVVGYLVQVTQRVMRREEHPLPEWKDLGTIFVLGFKYCVVYLVYMIPIGLLILPAIGLGIAAGASDMPEVIGIIASIYMFALVLLLIPYSLVLSAMSPIIAYRFALHERIGDALDVGAIVRDFRKNWQNTLVVALIVVGIESFASIGIIVFLVGVFFTIFYSYLVSAYLHGLLYRETIPQQLEVHP